MKSLDLKKLLSPVTAGSPSGENLEYDSAFSDMERSAQRTPEQQYGSTVIPAKDPDWDAVLSHSLDLAGRTRDLRVAIYLVQAILRTGGIRDVRDGLALLHGYVDTFWETVHPQLDPDDDNDPTSRVNTVATLCDGASFLLPLRLMPLVKSRTLGKFSRRDVGLATKELTLPEGSEEKPPEMSLIEAAFQDQDINQLKGDADAATEAVDLVRKLDAALTGHVGAGNARSLSAAVKELDAVRRILVDQLQRRGYDAGASEQPTAVGASAASAASGGAVSGGATNGRSPTMSGGSGQAFSWDADIVTRADALRLLEKVCGFFERHEPSSPIPLLLRRAKRLSSMSFLEILYDVSPDGVVKAEELGGVTRDEYARQKQQDSAAAENRRQAPPSAPPAPPASSSSSTSSSIGY